MSIDTDMWLTMKTTRQKKAMEAFHSIASGEDKVIDGLLARVPQGSVSFTRQNEAHTDIDGVVTRTEQWKVVIHTHTYRGWIPLEEMARHILDTYPDMELYAWVSNDSSPFYEVDQLDLSGQYYSFWLDPGDWEHFFQGDYMHSGSGRQLEHNRKAAENRKARENNPKENNDEDLPF